MKIVAIIQARSTSTRLPQKVLRDLYGKPVLKHVIERVKQCKLIDEIIIATTTNGCDDDIVKIALESKVSYYRGDEFDVLSRYYLAAENSKADVVIRLTSDCPLIDPHVIRQMIEFYTQQNDSELFVSNAGPLTMRTFPRGLDTEIFHFNLLKEAHYNAKEPHQREHVTPYLYENVKKYFGYKGVVDYSRYRWTLDTLEDWNMIFEVYKHLYSGTHNFYLSDIIKLVTEMPEIENLNKHVEQAYVQPNKVDLSLRRATIEDVELVFNWINDEEVRKQSFSSAAITYKDHLRWFEKILSNDDCHYFIAVSNNEPVGQIRIINEEGVATISYLIAPDRRGKGLGTELLKIVEREVYECDLGINALVGKVKSENIASIKAFIHNDYGYTIEEETYTFRKVIGGDID